MKKIIFLILCIFTQSSFATSSVFKLIDKEFEDGGEDEPSYTTYRYQSSKQLLKVKYVYRHSFDFDQDELTVQLDDHDTLHTQISGLLTIIDGDRFLPLLHLQKTKLQYPCHYTGEAEILVDDVEMILNEDAGDGNGTINLKSFKPLTSPQKSCSHF
ncbi:hypothetical protein [Acinetobacter brisouii]|uniref:hypothetical protein n=1 Tax=Acinetobacter brisouii TaxID=396323 RepID=UPI0035AE9965